MAGINAETAWTLQPSAPSVTVAVVDTGILPHPDLVGRVLPGYDFISDPGRARDGNARDPNPRDEGDWSDGECGCQTYDSFFHGLFVAGLIAANTNNGIGIAGVADGVNILPVRVLGVCGGTFEDVLDGMLWASGVAIEGVPANTTPAKIINMSLGGFGPVRPVDPGSGRRCARARRGRRGRRGQRARSTRATSRPRIAAASSPWARTASRASSPATRTSAAASTSRRPAATSRSPT